MREIKFRAWDRFNKQMRTDMRSNKFKHLFNLAIEYGSDFLDGHLMQYTGLKDKNGAEIYEGDIVKAKGEYPAIIEFSFGSFCINHIGFAGKWTSIRDVATDRYEVIGNIYENPELLEVQHD